MHMITVELLTWIGLIVLTMLAVRYGSLPFIPPFPLFVYVYFIESLDFCAFYAYCFMLIVLFLFLRQIRAGHLSGDCHYKREFLRGFMKVRGHEQVSSAQLSFLML